MRYFELNIGVFVNDNQPLPENFREWIKLADLCYDGSSPTTLNRVVEFNYPPKQDVVALRKKPKTHNIYM